MKNFKHFTKRTLSLLLALVMCVGLLQLTAFAKDTECPDGHTWSTFWSYDSLGHWHTCTVSTLHTSTKEEHSYGEWSEWTTVEGQPNLKVRQHTCIACGYLAKEYNGTDNDGWHVSGEGWGSGGGINHTHNYGEWTVSTPATCTENGIKSHSCTVSGCTATETQEIPALGHNWGDWSVTTPATCEGEGEETRVCSRDESHKETKPITKLGHDYPDEWTETTSATCEGKGEKQKVCGNDSSHVLKEDIDPLGHDWGDWKDNGDGTHSQVCKRDENHVNTEKVNHTYGEWTTTKEPTDTEPGEQERECDKCGHKETEEIPAKGEETPEEPEKPAPVIPVVPEIVITPKPSEEPTPSEEPGESPVPSEEPGEDISDDQPPMGNEPDEPGEDISDDQPPMGNEPDESGEDISDNQPPMGNEPDQSGEDISDNQPPMSGEPDQSGEDISDNQPPMSGEPDQSGEDISDNMPPMSDVPQTGEASNALWLAATLLASAGLVVVNTGKRKEERQ